MDPIAFPPFETTYDQRNQLNQVHNLRADHYHRLSRTGRGFLRDLTIASANFYSITDYLHILNLFCDGDPTLKNDRRYQWFSRRASRRGVLAIPFWEVDATRPREKGTWVRFRTDFVEPKYTSPLGSHNPPYIMLANASDEHAAAYKECILKEVLTESNLSDSPALRARAKDALNHTGYDRVRDGLKDPTQDLIVVEGEIKALSIFEAWLEQHKAVLKEALENPEKPLTELPVPHPFAVVGVVGVWGMISATPNGGEYTLHKDWAPLLTQCGEGRNVKLCFDSDSDWIVSVAHAATSTSDALTKAGLVPSYISIPSPNDTKCGADDWIILKAEELGDAEAAHGFVDLIKSSQLLEGKVSYGQLTRAQAEGQSPIGYLKNLALARQLREQPVAPAVSTANSH